VLNDDQVTKDAFISVAQKVAQSVAMRNANMEPTKVVQMMS
jgi:hypothetical protein